MVDLRYIRLETEKVKNAITLKGFNPKLIDEIVPLADDSSRLLAEIESLRSERKRVAKQGQLAIEKGREIKLSLDEREQRYNDSVERLDGLLLQIPNLPSDDAPVGPDESGNKIIKEVGEKPDISEPFDHMAIAQKLDLIDIARGVKIAESRFSFFKNEAVIVELGLIRLALDICARHGLVPMITPELVNQKTVQGTGYLPHGADEVYKTQDDLYLIGTSEQSLIAYHADEIIEVPKRYVGLSSCFRREAGTYGKDTKGVFRQHQFDKVEMVSFVAPTESATELEKILAIEEEIMATLELPYRIVEMCTGDLGFQSAKKFDVETWLPGQNTYRETHSCSNTTDFQARRLAIRYKNKDDKNELVHTLNGTAIAIGRTLIALLENGQQPDGRVKLPSKLAHYCGFDVIR